ncbi:MAG: PilZ domain-containing protein [Candidatus Acidiferrales bacterium]
MSPTSMDGRAERRTAVTVVVQLSCEQQAPFAEAVLPSEVALTENVSPHGARILCKHHWQANEPVLLTSAPSDLAAHARVVYCQPLRSGEYALGLHLVETNGTFSLDRQPAADVP